MPEVKEACRVCWNASNHKRKPQVTSIDQTYDDKKKRSRSCKVCKHVWNPVTVVEGAGGRWVSIRPRPPVPRREYELCNTWRAGRCVKGALCSFAHSQEELDVWNEEIAAANAATAVETTTTPPQQPTIAKSSNNINAKTGRSGSPGGRTHPPNPLPSGGEYRMCMHIQGSGACPFGASCHYAHSVDELEMWNSTGSSSSPPPPQPAAQPPLPSQRVSRMENEVEAKPKAGVRKRPPLPYTNVYKMCMHVEKGNRCMFGNGCIFAHSPDELQEWNAQLKQAAKQAKMTSRGDAPAPEPTSNLSAAKVIGESRRSSIRVDSEAFPPLLPDSDSVESISLTTPTSIATASSRAVDTGVEGAAMETESLTDDPPFVGQVREELANSGIKIEQLIEDKNGVEITEFNNRPLSVVWNSEDPIEWNLHVKADSLQSLSYVVLLDARFPEFRFNGVELSTSGKTPKQILQNCNLMGISLMKKINAKDSVNVKVIFRPTSGFFTQTVVFKFDGFFIGRILAVKMGESTLLQSLPTAEATVAAPDLSSRSLFWESAYEIIHFSRENVDLTSLPKYELPEDVEINLRSSAFDDMDPLLTMENYKERMHQLLYIEEYQRRMDFSRYDFYDHEIHFKSKIDDFSGIDVAIEGEIFIELKLNELLIESSSSIRVNDRALVRPIGESRAFEGIVFKVMREKIVLRVKIEVQEATLSRQNKADIRFTLNRNPFQCMHHGIDVINLDVIFPREKNAPIPDPVDLTRAMASIDRELNENQRLAVKSILHPNPCYKKIPSLICGPFGTGKTRTMREALCLLLAFYPTNRILICTHSNSAADLYVDAIHSLWKDKFNGDIAPLVRFYYKERRAETISPTVRQYTRFDTPSASDLSRYRVVISTLVTSYSVASSLPRGFFSHVFIDEAAQAMEAEALIPLMTASIETKIVLAGDHMQLEPPIQSDIARKFNLQRSLLERLYDSRIYKETVPGRTCCTNLIQNYRSVPEIIELASSLFYNNELQAQRQSFFPMSSPLAPLRFVGVKGTEGQDEDSPSYFNDFEAAEVANQVEDLVKSGIDPTEICALTPYMKQVQRIRHILRKKRYGKVHVLRIENVQGYEYRALILSTVRTCTEVPEDIGHESLGFLSNPKLFNTAVTRAKDFLVVVGDPYTLASVGENRGCWIEFIGRCRQMKSFIFRDNDEFERKLEASIQTRHLAQMATSSPSPIQTVTKVTPQTLENFRRASSRARNNVLTQYLFPLVKQKNERLAHPITGKLLELDLEEIFHLLTVPAALTQRVHQIARELKNPQTAPQSTRFPSPRPEPSPPAVAAVVAPPAAASPSAQPPQVAPQPEKSITSHVNVRNQTVLFLLQLQLDCLNEHERQLNAEVQRVRPLSPFSTSTLETLLQQQLHLLQQQKAAVQKQYHLYRGYVNELKVKQESMQQPYPRTQAPFATSVSSSPLAPQSPGRSAFPVPNLGTSIGKQRSQASPSTSTIQRPPPPSPQLPPPPPQPSPQPVIANSPHRPFFPPNVAPNYATMSPQFRMSHPGAIGSGRQSAMAINQAYGPFAYPGQTGPVVNGPIGSNVQHFINHDPDVMYGGGGSGGDDVFAPLGRR